jgi:hypothetical protein
MSLNRYVKIPSVQSGKFNLTNLNRIDFDLDPNMVYDLDNSWIELNVNVTAEESTSGKSGVYKVKAQMVNHADVKLENSMMVKNCHLRSAMKGMLEDIRDVNILRANLSELMDSSTDKQGKAFKNVGHLFESNQLKSSLFRELHKEGNVSSRNVEAPIRIKMSELFNLGSLREFDTRMLGRCRVHIELDNVLSFSPQTETEMGGSADMADITGAATNINSFTTDNSLKVLEESPLWVGEAVKINATGAGGAANITDHYALITSITYNNDRTLTVTVDDAVTDLGAGESYTNVSIAPVPADTSEFTVDSAELVSQVVSNPSAPAGKMSYTTYTTEQYNANGLTTFQRLYQVEPEAVSLMVMFPKNANGLLSHNANISNYRLKIDNVDQTDRNIVPHTPLYYQFLNDTMLDAGLPIANLNEYNLSASERGQDKRVDANRLVFIPAKLEQTQREKNVQININSTAGGVGFVNLYKLVVREV